ncbi:MAG: hypothetical protein D6806_18645 [Deltaproteobacteria bacterium]|nr:MAG: hypothetical protein D6806_18645 [Deltaproteobacteria bacterium]
MRLNALACAMTAAAWLYGCGRAQPPPYAEQVFLEGDAYQRGYQHGRLLESKIRSLYTMLLETNLMPYLNREQADIMSFLVNYQQPEYQNGQFSYRMMLESGQHLLETLEREYPQLVDEMRGIADGAGVPFEQILIMNTFVDTMLAFRSVTFFIRQLQSPRIEQMEILAALDSDGIDNNGDGSVDDGADSIAMSDRGGQWHAGYQPRPYAQFVEVPPEAAFRFLFYDPPGIGGFGGPDDEPKEGDVQGMDPESVRIQLDGELFLASDPEIETELSGENGEYLEVVFKPPVPLEPASVHTLVVSAHNRSKIVTPPPEHPRVMRDERIVFTTAGYGLAANAVKNVGTWDERSTPSALVFGLKGQATADRSPLLAHHFVLLDANIVHKHTVLFHHRTESGREFAVIGWAGLLWGFSGMNEDGLSIAFNPSDTLDNPLAGQVRKDLMYAKLLLEGIPMGMQLRLALERASSVEEAIELMRTWPATFGWNMVLADAQGDLRALERDSNILSDSDGGFIEIEPGSTAASAGPADLRLGMHFSVNVPDIDTQLLIFDVQPQSWWSSFWYRSLRTVYLLDRRMMAGYGSFTADNVVKLLKDAQLTGSPESMNAVVFEPARRVLHYAMGTVPAPEGDFVTYSLGGGE